MGGNLEQLRVLISIHLNSLSVLLSWLAYVNIVVHDL